LVPFPFVLLCDPLRLIIFLTTKGHKGITKVHKGDGTDTPDIKRVN